MISLTIILLFAVFTAIILYVLYGLVSEHAVTVSTASLAGETVLVIDAGHGGLDGGAAASDGTKESVLNLEISQRMEQLAKLLGIPTVMTRSKEELEYPQDAASIHEKMVWDQKNRATLINSQKNAVLISVHQNTYPDPRPRGTEVLYAKTEGSQKLAEITQESLTRLLDPMNRRVAAPISDKIYLMKNVRCTAILVECGFLSNAEDTEKMKDPRYQKKLAAVLIVSFLTYETLNC